MMDRSQKRISLAANVILLIAMGLFLVSLLGSPVKGEAYSGNFDAIEFNENWKLVKGTTSSTVTLPLSLTEVNGVTVILENTLPDYVSDGMSMATRAALQDMHVYIGDTLRSSYAQDNFERMYTSLPSSTLITELTDEDAGKTIRLMITSRTSGRGRFNGVTIGYGNNVWFPVLFANFPVVIAGLFMIVLGILSIAGYIMMRRKLKTGRAVFYLGETMTAVGMWILSESTIRQLIFNAPSYSSIYSYLLVEIMACFVALYFNEVQNHHYSRVYKAIAAVILLQLIINSILNFGGIARYFDTLIFSHIWMGLAIAFVIFSLIMDVRTNRIRNYSITSAGMVFFLGACVAEMLRFYLADFYILGVYIGFGLIVMLVATVAQTISDEIRRVEERQQRQSRMTAATIETIAGALDAKDVYTGGHSERVAGYAETLARAVAGEYGFTEEDIARIHYIGLMHDIGKISVPDAILNKAGKLTDEEYALMKQHTVIGYDLLRSIDSVDGLGDGVRYHHERYDGNGYPDGLSGEDIPIFSRILCLADCYDAMTSNRVYRKRLPDETVREELLRCAGTQFDPKLTGVFVDLMDRGALSEAASEQFHTGTGAADLYKSSMLEKLITHIQDTGAAIPESLSFVRMAAYMVKQAEERKEAVQVLLFTLSTPEGMKPSDDVLAEGAALLERTVSTMTRAADISIQCSGTQRIVVLFGAAPETAVSFGQMAAESFNRACGAQPIHLFWESVDASMNAETVRIHT